MIKIVFKIVLTIIGVCLLIVLSSIYGIPLGSERGGSNVVGSSLDGREILLKGVWKYRFHTLSPEGPFQTSSVWYGVFYERANGEDKEIKCLEEPTGYGWHVLKPIYSVPSTNTWIAFRTIDMSREMAQIRAIIFDNKHIINIQDIDNAIRVSLRDYENPNSYSIESTDGKIMIKTKSGTLVYNNDKHMFINQP